MLALINLQQVIKGKAACNVALLNKIGVQRCPARPGIFVHDLIFYRAVRLPGPFFLKKQHAMQWHYAYGGTQCTGY
jgi:hypothetical protein